MKQFRSNKGFAGAPRKVGHIPEGGARIITIAEALGYYASFQPARVASIGKAYYVSIYRLGNSCIGRCHLGRLDVLAVLSDAELRAAMVEALNTPKGTLR